MHSIQDGSADRHRGRRLGSPAVHRSPPVAPAAGEWQVTQLGDWFGNWHQDRRLTVVPAVAVLKGSKHPAEAMEFLDWFNTQVDDLVSQGLVRGCHHRRR